MYYPKQRLMSSMRQITRQATLPEEATGSVQAQVGQRVEIRDKVARGLLPARHIIIDAVDALGLRDPVELVQQMKVQLRTPIQKGQLIAGGEGRRDKKIVAPFQSIVMAIDAGTIILQEMPQVVTLEAGVRGTVQEVYEGRGVKIVGHGAIVQGVWGNGRNVIAALRVEPDDGGLETLSTDTLDTQFRGEAIVTKSTLTANGLQIAAAREFAAVIAPSMTASLIPIALEAPFAIIITSGFGTHQMNSRVYNLLLDYVDNQATVDAAQPRRFDERRPAVVINRYAADDMPDHAENVKLERGMEVRITRPPYQGRIGTVIDLPNNPVMMENGLRVMCARVRVSAASTVDIPLLNLELGGA